MKLKTKQQLIDEGWKFIAINRKERMNIEVYARFTGYQDIIQWIYHKEGTMTSDKQVVSYGELCLKEKMLKVMREDYMKQNIYSNMTEKPDLWEDINGKL
jgi:Cu2+-containing amine oxidase